MNSGGIMDNKRMMRKIISYILSFLLSVCITLLAVMFVIKFGVLDEKNLYRNMSSSGYYDYIYNELIEYEKSVITPTGLPDTILDDAITPLDVRNDINGKLSAQFKGTRYESSSTQMAKRLNDAINIFFKSKDYTPTDAEKKSVEEYVNVVVRDYENSISLPFGKYIVQINNMLGKIFWIAVAALLIVSTVIIYVILNLHRWLHRSIRFLSVSALGSGAMLIILPAYIMIQHVYSRLSISTKSLYYLIVSYINSVLMLFICFGILMIVISVALFVMTVIAKKNSMKRKHA